MGRPRISPVRAGRVMLKDPSALVVAWATVVVAPRILVQFRLTTAPETPWPGQFPVDVQQSWPPTVRPPRLVWPWARGFAATKRRREINEEDGGGFVVSHMEVWGLLEYNTLFVFYFVVFKM